MSFTTRIESDPEWTLAGSVSLLWLRLNCTGHSERWRVYAGYGHLFPGSYLRQSGCSSALRTVYLLSSFTF
jgi:hypothetical protein